ncbi:uncharacterized protein [Primulina huaijiensis]|uniref:uncharacterized protein n=1 Tax=Primulina huaijiensis TaxID=1492673 RepID=UPI003CC776E3
MGKTKRELLKPAPWRDAPEDGDNKFQDARLKVSSEPDGIGENSLSEIDLELRYSFQRNFQFPGALKLYKQLVDADVTTKLVKNMFLQHVFSVDTVVKPLPPSVAYNVSRNLTFFTRIFTQFFDPDGIADAQKSLWLGQEEKVRKVR